jgi:V/A-type H+-transporting ATPase subunit E
MKADVQENMDSLSRAIMAEARDDAEDLLKDARARAETIRKQAQAQADQVRQEILDRAKAEADQLRSQNIATTQLKARTMQLDHREKLLDQVFSSAMEDIPSIQKWTDYPEIARDMLREAITQLRADEVVVHADPHTQSALADGALDALEKELNVQISIGDPLDKGTGVVVETNNGRLQYDNTLETRLRRLQNSLRVPVYHILMGEKL